MAASWIEYVGCYCTPGILNFELLINTIKLLAHAYSWHMHSDKEKKGVENESQQKNKKRKKERKKKERKKGSAN